MTLALRADRHEDGRRDLAVGGVQHPRAGGAVGGDDVEVSDHRIRDGVAEGVEAVAFVDRRTVQDAHLVDAGERHHQRQQRGARQVEVGDHGAHDRERAARA